MIRLSEYQKTCDDMFIRLNTLPALDRQTCRQRVWPLHSLGAVLFSKLGFQNTLHKFWVARTPTVHTWCIAAPVCAHMDW